MPTFVDLRLDPNKPRSWGLAGRCVLFLGQATCSGSPGPVQVILTFGNGSDDVE